MNVDLPVAVGNMSLGGSLSYAEGIEFGETPDAIDVLLGVPNPGRTPYELDLDVFSYQLQVSWSDEMRIPSSVYSRLSYGVDVNYAARDQRFAKTDERDKAFSGSTVRGPDVRSRCVV